MSPNPTDKLISEAERIASEAEALLSEIDSAYGAFTPDLKGEEERQRLALLTACVDQIVVASRMAKNVLARKGYWSSPRDDRLYSLGDGSVEFNSSTPRKKWDNERLMSVVVEKLIEAHVDKETGVIPPPAVLMSKLFQLFRVDYWKVSALRELGLDPDRYSEEGSTSYSATVKR